MVEMVGLFVVAAVLVGAVVLCVEMGMGMNKGLVNSETRGKA